MNEQWTEPEPIAGAWESVSDDATGTVTVTGPDATEQRPYGPVEQVSRAASIYAAKLQERADQLDTALGQLDAALAAVDAAQTISEVDPTEADAEGREVGSVWEVRAGDVLVRRFVLTDPTTWTQVVLGPDALAAESILARHLAVDALDFKTATGMELLAAILTGATVNGGHFYSPSSTSLPRVHIGDSTVEVWRGDEGAEYRTVSLGGSDSDELKLMDSTGSPLFSVTADGNASVRNRLSTAALTLGGRDLETLISTLPLGLVGGWYGPTASSWPIVGNTPLGIGLVPFEAQQYRRYTADFIGQFTPEQAGDILELTVRVRTASTNAYVTDAAIFTARVSLAAGTNLVALPPVQYYSGYTGPTTILVAARNASTTTRGITLAPQSARIHVSDEGPGAISWGRASTAGGTPFSGAAVEETPQASTRDYTFQATSLRSWRGSSTVTDYLHHGYWGGFQRHSWIGFDSAAIASALSGATGISARLQLRNVHTYNGRSMSVRIGRSTATSAPASVPTGTSAATYSWTDGALAQVSIPWDASSRSVVLGEGAGTSTAMYGKFSYSLSDIKLIITCTK